LRSHRQVAQYEEANLPSQQTFNQPEFVTCETRQKEVAPHVFTSGASKSAALAVVPQQVDRRRSATLNVGYEETIESLWKLRRYPAGSAGDYRFCLPERL
jgi:hypothetical protein